MTERIRVLHITSRLNVGGLARLVLMACERLDRNRHECLLVTGRVSAAEGDLLAVERRQARRLIVIPELGRNPAPWHDLAALIKLYRLIRQFRPAIVHTHAAKAGALGRLAASAAGVPVRIHSYHGHVFSGYFPWWISGSLVRIERALARLTTAIAVPSASQRTEIAATYHIAPPGKIRIVPYGLDVEFFRSSSLDGDAVRSRYGIPASARVVGAVGRMVRVKNHALLLDGFERLVSAPGYEDVHLLIVGSGECRPAIEARAAACSAAPRIHLAGWMQDLREAYAAIDVLALTSTNEGMPVAVLEAMAAGVPVVSTPAGGVVDLITSEANGLLLGGFSAAELAGGLARLLDDPPLRDRLAVRARRQIAALYSDAVHVTSLEQLYTELVSARN